MALVMGGWLGPLVIVGLGLFVLTVSVFCALFRWSRESKVWDDIARTATAAERDQILKSFQDWS